jgi:hypothetical protein
MLGLSLLVASAASANHGAPSDSERCGSRLEETETNSEKHQILEELQEKEREISALRRRVSALEYELSLTKHLELSTGAAAANTQELMLWWLPASSRHIGGEFLTIYSPLHGSMHGKGSFLLAFKVQQQQLPPGACVLAEYLDPSGTSSLLALEVLVDNAAGAMRQQIQARGSGWSRLSLTLLSSGGSGGRMFCPDENNEADILEHWVVTFRVFETSLKKVEVDGTFPDMHLTCTNAYSHHVRHLCRSAEVEAGSKAMYVRLTPSLPYALRSEPAQRPGTMGASARGGGVAVGGAAVTGEEGARDGGGEGGVVGAESGACFMLQVFSLDTLSSSATVGKAGDAWAREGGEGADEGEGGAEAGAGVRVFGMHSGPAGKGGSHGGVGGEGLVVPGDGRPVFACFLEDVGMGVGRDRGGGGGGGLRRRRQVGFRQVRWRGMVRMGEGAGEEWSGVGGGEGGEWVDMDGDLVTIVHHEIVHVSGEAGWGEGRGEGSGGTGKTGGVGRRGKWDGGSIARLSEWRKEKANMYGRVGGSEGGEAGSAVGKEDGVRGVEMEEGGEMERGKSEGGGIEGGGIEGGSEVGEGEGRVGVGVSPRLSERKGVVTLISSLDYLVGALVLFFSLRAACPSNMPGEA